MKKWFGLFTVLLLVNPSFAQFRKYANEFLSIGAGSRSQAMGNAQVASSSDAFAAYWNPAGLTQIQNQPQIGYMHAIYFNGIGKYDFGSIAIPSKNKKTVIAATVLRFAIDDIPNTLFLFEPDGRPNYNNITTFSSADYAFLFSIAKKVRDNAEKQKQLSWGANLKVIHRKIGTFATAWGLGLDAGIQYKSKRWQLGAVLRDATTTFTSWQFNFTDAEKEKLYLTNNAIPVKSSESQLPRLMLGLGYKIPFKNPKSYLMAELNADLTFDGRRNTVISTDPLSVDPKLGLELGINSNVFIRAGIFNFQQAIKDGDTTANQKTWIFQPGAGLGFNINNVTIDYAFSNLANQSDPLYSHVFSLKLNLVKQKKQTKKTN
jgi:hypothetical protein